MGIISKGSLEMEDYNYLADSTARLWVYSEKTKNDFQKTASPILINITAGQNFIEYDLGRRMRLRSDIIYEAVLINSRGEKFFMKFKNKD